MPYFNIVAETNENTVVTEYEPVKKRYNSDCIYILYCLYSFEDIGNVT